MAFSKTAMLSLQCPKTVLHLPHTSPRVLPVAWSWSMERTAPKREVVPVLQIAQTPFWSASILSNCSMVSPYFLSLFRRIIARYFSGFFFLHCKQVALCLARLFVLQSLSISISWAVRGGRFGSRPDARLAFLYSRWLFLLSLISLYGIDATIAGVLPNAIKTLEIHP